MTGARSLPLVLALALGAPAAVAGQTSALAEVEAAERARFRAQTGSDTLALHGLLSDDLVYIHSNALVESKAHFIETVALRRIVYDSIVPIEMSHRLYGNTAVGNGKVRVRGRINGAAFGVDLLFTTVLVRRDGQWQLVAWQSTRAQ